MRLRQLAPIQPAAPAAATHAAAGFQGSPDRLEQGGGQVALAKGRNDDHLHR